MNKIFILDIMFSYGHKKFNYYYLRMLSKYYKLIILNDGKYYNSLDIDGVEICDFHKSYKTSNSIAIRKNMISTFWKIKYSGILNTSDSILIMGYDTLIFPIFFIINNPKIKVFTIQHHNLDEYKNKLKRLAFNTYKNKMNHLVLDSEFVDMLKTQCYVKSDIHYLPHYLSKNGICKNISLNAQKIIALSNSNDENKIKDLIELDEKNGLKDSKIQIVIKSKNYDYQSDNLKILKRYISDEVYLKEFCEANAILLLFPDTYNIRFSCTLIEALINYKFVIGNCIPFVKIYKKRYPNNIFIFNSSEELLRIINNLDKYRFDLKEHEVLMKELSDKMIEERLLKILSHNDIIY